MHLILTGASGFVGSLCLDYMLNDAAVTKISILSRKPVPQADGHSKATVIIHSDMAVYDEATLNKLAGAVGCVWTLGPSMLAVSKKEFEYATRDLPVAAAKIFATLNDNFKLVYVSHDGIDDWSPRWRPYVYQIKGQAEENLLELSKSHPSLRFYSVRPAVIDYATHDAIKPYIKQPLPLPKRFTEAIMPLLRWANPQTVMTSQDLGRVMTLLACGDGGDLAVAGASHGGRIVGVAGVGKWLKERDASSVAGK